MPISSLIWILSIFRSICPPPLVAVQLIVGYKDNYRFVIEMQVDHSGLWDVSGAWEVLIWRGETVREELASSVCLDAQVSTHTPHTRVHTERRALFCARACVREMSLGILYVSMRLCSWGQIKAGAGLWGPSRLLAYYVSGWKWDSGSERMHRCTLRISTLWTRHTAEEPKSRHLSLRL